MSADRPLTDAATAPTGPLAAIARVPMPLRDNGVLTPLVADQGRAEVVLRPRPWALANGVVTLGGLALVADDAMGLALATLVPGTRVGVAARLNIELLAMPSPGAEIHARARAVQLDEHGGVTTCSLIDAATGSRLALATVRSVVIAGPSIDSMAARALSSPLSEPEALDTAHAFFANPLGIMHGGVLTLLAVRAAARSHSDRTPLAITSTFLRPAEADGSAFSCHSSDLRVGRRVITATSDVMRSDGAVAVTSSVVLGDPPPESSMNEAAGTA